MKDSRLFTAAPSISRNNGEVFIRYLLTADAFVIINTKDTNGLHARHWLSILIFS